MSRSADIQHVTRWLKAMGDETRVRIVALLAHGELCVCHIETATAVAQSVTSRHLGILRAAAIVEARRQGQWVYYRLAAQTDSMCADLLASMVKQFNADPELSRLVDRVTRSLGPPCPPKAIAAGNTRAAKPPRGKPSKDHHLRT